MQKTIKTSCTLALLLAFLPVFASAAERHKHVTLGQNAVVGSQELKPGSYTLKYDDANQSSPVKFVLDGKTVATVPAQVQHDANATGANYIFDSSTGQNKISRIYVGPSEELVFSTSDNQAAEAK